MCSVGGPPDLDFDMGQVEEYKCKNCGSEFKGIGKSPSCPKCSSENVEPRK